MAGEWNRLTRHAKRSVIESQELAASLGGSSVQPEHLLLTLMDDSTSAAAVLFALVSFPMDEVRSVVEERLAADTQFEDSVEKPAFSPAMRRLVEDAGILAGTGAVGSEHLALAALATDSTLGAAVKEVCSMDANTLISYLDILEGHELKGRSTAGAQRVPTPPAPAGSAAGSAAARLGGAPAARYGPPSTPNAKAPPSRVAEAAAPRETPASAGPSADPRSHTLMALARLIIDLAGKAASVARAHGSPSVADQLDRMRGEVETHVGLAKSPASGAEKTSLPDVRSA